jgi:ATP/maltotriose-dependent transcriptional regulator MalT
MIDQRTNRSVLWVTGLPGSGKSALVSSYLRACRLRGLWYRIDSGDHHPAGFFYYLGLAVNQAAPRMSTPLPLLTPEYRGGIAAFCQSYFRSLFSRIEPPFFLVFDDCHLLTEKDSFFELIKIGIAEAVWIKYWGSNSICRANFPYDCQTP